MARLLLLYEDQGWRSLRPLTDVTPVMALAFGASSLGSRWRDAVGLPLMGIEARAEALACWTDAPAMEAHPGSEDEVLVGNAAALPGAWLEHLIKPGPPCVFVTEGRVAGARVPWSRFGPGLERGSSFDSFLLGLGLPEVPVETRFACFPWQLVEWNPEAITRDLDRMRAGLEGEIHPLAAILGPERVRVESGARVDPFAVLDGRSGPIHIGAGVQVRPHTVVTGPCVVGAGTELLGGFVGRSTFGPQCRIAGEVEDSIWQGYANKRHHGFIGHSVIGPWVNLGALTTTSDLKNNYGAVRVWVDGQEIDSGSSKVGAFIGAHVKTGIGTLLPTGASVGTGTNLFGGGRFAPKQTPAFSWWDGERMVEHRLEPFLATARTAMGRRRRSLGAGETRALSDWFESTAGERARFGERG